MSRAFVTENDSWAYCIKAGDTCLYAERGRECKKQDCEFNIEPDKSTGDPGAAESEDN